MAQVQDWNWFALTEDTYQCYVIFMLNKRVKSSTIVTFFIHYNVPLINIGNEILFSSLKIHFRAYKRSN